MTTKKNKQKYDFYADLENIKEAFVDATQHAKGRAGNLISQSVDEVKGKSTDLKDSVEEYVSEKPFKSLGVALIAGMCLGFLLRK